MTIKIISFLKRQFYKFIGIPISRLRLESIHILDSKKSIQYIIDNRCSVSRFGDGEFDILMGKDGNTFQKANQNLAERLKEVLTATDAPNHIVGLPYPLKDTSNLRPSSRDFWGFYTLWYGKTLKPYFSNKRIYLDTQLSRFYIMYKNKSHCQTQLRLLKKIWDDRNIVIIEGKYSRTGVGNNLYDNVRSLQRIIGLSTNAFDKYNEMLEAIKQNVSKDKLILLSYGMCATVLAYDLAKLGYWAIDIGHIDTEYEWMRMGVTENTPIQGKFTNEAGNEGRGNIEECKDDEYNNQIICSITHTNITTFA